MRTRIRHLRDDNVKAKLRIGGSSLAEIDRERVSERETQTKCTSEHLALQHFVAPVAVAALLTVVDILAPTAKAKGRLRETLSR